MKYIATFHFILLSLVGLRPAVAQETLPATRITWSASLPAGTGKTIADASGNTWSLSGANTFQVVDAQGTLRWTKTLSALTVTDFAVDPAGQLLLVGLPASGQPVVEKYDASQIFAWRNVLDSLSNAPGQGDKLSVTLSPTGSGLVLGTNRTTDRRLTYYFVTAAGKLGTPVSVSSASGGSLVPIRPVGYNKNEVLFGFNQPNDLGVPPTFYRLKADSLTAKAQAPEQPDIFRYLNYTIGYTAYPTSYSSLPLLTDGQKAYGFFVGSNTKTDPTSTTTIRGYEQAVFDYTIQYAGGPADQPRIQGLTSLTAELTTVAEATSRLVDKRGNLFATPATSTTAPTADLLLNRYTTDNLRLLNSLKLGVASNAGQASPIRRLDILASNPDGSLLVAGTTSGTVTVGTARFAGTPETPARFLLTIAPEPPKQLLTANQVGWSATLPIVTKQVITNALKQTWVQLPDSTFRYYNAQGKLVWEKKLATEGIRQIGADALGNLYILANAEINKFDSTGALTWSVSYQPKVSYAYSTQWAIRPEGGGQFVEVKNYELDMTEFDKDGKLLASSVNVFNSYAPYYTYSPNYVVARADGRIIFGYYVYYNRTNPGEVPGSLVSYSPSGINTQAAYTDPIRWLGAAGKTLYIGGLVKNQLSFAKADTVGSFLFKEVNTPKVNAIGLALSKVVSPAGTLFTLSTAPRGETASTTVNNLIINEYSANIDLRNTTRVGTYTTTTGQGSSSFTLVQAYADGSLLLSGSTTSTLTIGPNTYAGSPASPVRFLTLLKTTVAQVVLSTTAICSNVPTTLNVQYKGYLSQAPSVEVYAGKTLVESVRVPFSTTLVADTTITVSLPFSTGVAPGLYQLRSVVGPVSSNWVSVSVTAAPAAPVVKQEGDELVGTAAAGTYQWYDGQNKPIGGATNPRYKPTAAGTYYLVNTNLGCSSGPASVAFIITATEPVSDVVLYPNPATNRLVVRWPGAGANARIYLTDAQGRVLQDMPRQGDATDVPTQGMPPGMLLVQLRADGQPTLVRKVLIQR